MNGDVNDGAVAAVIGATGAVLVRRQHYGGLGALAAVRLAAAIVVRDSFSPIGDKAIAVAVLVVVTSTTAGPATTWPGR